MKFNPWFKCDCGKLHTATFVHTGTKCSCGLHLYLQMVNKVQNVRKPVK